jgi:hypothetical protein
VVAGVVASVVVVGYDRWYVRNTEFDSQFPRDVLPRGMLFVMRAAEIGLPSMALPHVRHPYSIMEVFYHRFLGAVNNPSEERLFSWGGRYRRCCRIWQGDIDI